MVVEQEFPAAFYGKSPSNDGGDQYRLLGRSRDFPQDALVEFEKMAKAIEWTGGGGNDPYRACYGVWPVSKSGAIVARFTDSGPDLLNRPHTLRIEAAWVAKGRVADWPAAIGELLQDIAWLNRSTDTFDAPLRLSLGNSNFELGTNVAEVLKSTASIPSILIASHKNYRASGFDIIQDPDGPSGANRMVRRSQGNRHPSPSLPVRSQFSGTSKQGVWPTLFLIVVCVLLIALIGWEYLSRQQLQSRYDTLDGEFLEMKISLEDVSKNRDKLQQDLQNTSQELKEVSETLQQLQNERQEYISLLQSHGITNNADLKARLMAFDQRKRRGDKEILDPYAKTLLEQRIEFLKKSLDRYIQEQERTIESLKQLRESVRDEGPHNRNE